MPSKDTFLFIMAGLVIVFFVVFILGRSSGSVSRRSRYQRRRFDATELYGPRNYRAEPYGQQGSSLWLVFLILLLLGGVVIWQWPLVSSLIPLRVPAVHLPLQQQPSIPFSDTVMGGPDMTAVQVDHVLQGSPAQGIGDELTNLSKQYQIKSSFALAMFHYESNFGREGVARITKSWGNIKCTSGWKCDPTGNYRMYATYADGLADFFEVIKQYYFPEGRTTVASILPKYAPAYDHNNVSKYIASVRRDMQHYQEGQL
ncbi:glucosaminidase domain-containing protein [Ktedonosporobacter rubrisoli]|nr:glucosaminidase domain-containing protein [Ktedonosporobacter rubrisoli]